MNDAERLAFDVIVIGGGIAGASVAAELADRLSVVVLEAEAHCGYHSTGRSAAIYIESYGNAAIRKLTRASGPLLRSPPAVFSEHGFLSPRGVLYLARDEDRAALDALLEEPAVVPLALDEAYRWVPILRRDYYAGAAVERGACDIDVAALHQAYLRKLRRAGGRVECRAPVESLSFAAGRWRVQVPEREFQAPLVINAAGAWADGIARLAGAAPLGLKPLRRSMAVVPPPPSMSLGDWPLVADIAERFYFKPDGGKLFVSPADETPVEPHDAFVDDLVLAEGLDRFQQAVTFEVARVERSWAGLRTFTPDCSTVAGFDPWIKGFFWLAGQGGYGIQTAPAMAQVAAALVTGDSMPDTVQATGLDPASLSPARLGTSGPAS